MNSRRDAKVKPEWAQDLNRGSLEGLTYHAPWAPGALGHGAQPREARSLAVYRALRALPRRVRRALQRKFARSLAEVALLLALGQGTAWAATINVTGACTLSKAIEAANNNNTAGGVCTAGSGADTIVLAAGSTHTLTVADNSTYGATGLPVVTSTITITGNGSGSTIERSSADSFRLLAVAASGNLTLQNLTLQGGQAYYDGVDFITGGGGAILNNFGTCTVTKSTITGNTADQAGGGVYNNGVLTLTNSTVSGNTAYDLGGGVYNYMGTATLTNSTVSGNTAYGIGGVSNFEGIVTLTNSTVSDNSSYHLGGGVATDSGTVTLIQSTVSGNSTSKNGGGIYVYQGSVTVIQSAIKNNSAGIFGGGLFNKGVLTLANSTVTGNSAPYRGGGLYNYQDISGTIIGSLTLSNSTVSGNTAYSYNVTYSSTYGYGGGIFNVGVATIKTSTLSGNDAYCGGGLYNHYGSVSLTNSTLSGNSVLCSGGGINNRYNATLTHTTISDNVAGKYGGGVENTADLTLVHTLISGNLAFSGVVNPGPEVDNFGGGVTSDAFNLFGHDSDNGVYGFTPTVPTDIVPSQTLAEILETALDFNGGRTQTHDLVSGSAAVNAITDTSHGGPCPATDQRGFVRNVGNCDVGAVELGASAPPIVNSQVTLVMLPATFSTNTDSARTTAACGSGFAGTFFFQARVTKKPGATSLAALKAAVVTLSNNNQLQTADGGNGSAGAQQTLPQVGAFSDEAFSAGETLDVPFVICLKNLNSFAFFVNVLGL